MHNSIKERCALEEFTKALDYFPDMDEGTKDAPLDNVFYFKRYHYKSAEPTVYRTGLCILLSGKKRMTFEEHSYEYSALDYIVCSMMIHAQCETFASFVAPVRGIFIGFSVEEIRELVESMNLRGRIKTFDSKHIPSPIGPSTMDGDFQDSLVRFLKCLSDENEAKVLGKALKREVLYRALCGEQSELLLKLSLQAGPLVQINKVIDVLEQNYNQEIDVDNLAKEVNLSVSSFYRLFKDVTSDTPVQYLKKIRLNKAKEMIITQNAKAYVAALEVGYQSVSQFSREFKRYFGVTPAALKVS